jgi:hypothetical protein
MMEPYIDFKDRQFQVWAYSVSMARLLLRSTKTETSLSRIDVLFQNVKAMSLPTTMDGLVVSDACSNDKLRKRVMAELGSVQLCNDNLYCIQMKSTVGYVVASLVVVQEDEREFFEASRLWPDVAKASRHRAREHR